MTEQHDNLNEKFTQEDIEKNKVFGILAYIIFFIPLIAAKDSPFARYHANQGLIIVLLSIANMIVGMILDNIPIIGWLIGLALSIGIFVLWLIGLLNAVNGKAKPIPLAGGITIIK